MNPKARNTTCRLWSSLGRRNSFRRLYIVWQSLMDTSLMGTSIGHCHHSLLRITISQTPWERTYLRTSLTVGMHACVCEPEFLSWRYSHSLVIGISWNKRSELRTDNRLLECPGSSAGVRRAFRTPAVFHRLLDSMVHTRCAKRRGKQDQTWTLSRSQCTMEHSVTDRKIRRYRDKGNQRKANNKQSSTYSHQCFFERPIGSGIGEKIKVWNVQQRNGDVEWKWSHVYVRLNERMHARSAHTQGRQLNWLFCHHTTDIHESRRWPLWSEVIIQVYLSPHCFSPSLNQSTVSTSSSHKWMFVAHTRLLSTVLARTNSRHRLVLWTDIRLSLCSNT